ncbi:STE20-related kinase adapter protein alpha-like isoform X2 [Lineus longissimus]
MSNPSVTYRPDQADYQLLAVIGRGSQERATICLALHKPSNTHVAIRRVKLDLYEEEFYGLQHEIFAAKQLQHNNILPYLCTFINKNEIWIVMPMMGFGSCKDLIHAHFTHGLPEAAISYILRDVLQALEYLHGRGHIHRSIRASHIVLSGQGHVCLTGLRCSTSMWKDGRKLKAIHEFPKKQFSAIPWASPEVLEQNLLGYDTRADIYSVGILACELANGVVPFVDMAPTQVLLTKVDGPPPQLLDSTTVIDVPMDDNAGTQADSGLGGSTASATNKDSISSPYTARTFSPHFHHFVNWCLQGDAKDRPSSSTLLNHPFFKQIRRRSVESLPSLILPVTPLTSSSVISQNQESLSALTDLTDQMETVALQDEWVY